MRESSVSTTAAHNGPPSMRVFASIEPSERPRRTARCGLGQPRSEQRLNGRRRWLRWRSFVPRYLRANLDDLGARLQGPVRWLDAS
jgi:hypothetical protein